MSWLPVVSDEQASPEVKKIYEYIGRRWSFVPNYFRALGHDAQLLQDQTNFFTDLMFEERGLARIVKEQLAIVVSGINVSSYCLPAHMEILSRLGVDKKMGRKLSLDFRNAPVEPKTMKLFEFAEKLTKRPGEMEKSDVEQLRQAGWRDAEILDAVMVTSAYALANRFSSGLGLIADF
jgi:uncharacterized peroxidase-related enzyme